MDDTLTTTNGHDTTNDTTNLAPAPRKDQTKLDQAGADYLRSLNSEGLPGPTKLAALQLLADLLPGYRTVTDGKGGPSSARVLLEHGVAYAGFASVKHRAGIATAITWVANGLPIAHAMSPAVFNMLLASELSHQQDTVERNRKYGKTAYPA